MLIIITSYIYFIFLFLSYIFIKIYIGYKHKKNSTISFNNMLHQYYISNFFITIFKSFLYVFFSAIIFLILRLYLIKNDIHFNGVAESFLSFPVFLKLALFYILFVLFIVIYYRLINKFFFEEINKLYLFCLSISIFKTMQKYFMFKYFTHFFGCLRVICYRIYTFTFPKDIYDIGFDSGVAFVANSDVEFILFNKKINKFGFYMMKIIKIYPLLGQVFRFLAYIFRLIYIHCNGVYNAFPLFILGYIFMLELYNKNFVYLKIFLLFYFIFLLKNKIKLFFDERSGLYDNYLMLYYYKNSMPYIEQYKSVENKNHVISTTENRTILIFKDRILEYINNKFKKTHTENKKIKGLYNRIMIILLLIGLSYFLLALENKIIITSYLFEDISVKVFLWPMPLIMYCAYKTFYVSEYEEDHEFYNYEYSKKHHIMFWVFTIVQGYIFWILIFKSQVIFMDSEILWNYIITIKKIYVVEDKIIYLYEYTDYLIKIAKLQTDMQDYLRNITLNIPFSNIITDDTTLLQLQEIAKTIVFMHEQFDKAFILVMINNYIQESIYEGMVSRLTAIDDFIFIIVLHVFLVSSSLFILLLPLEYQKLVVECMNKLRELLVPKHTHVFRDIYKMTKKIPILQIEDV